MSRPLYFVVLSLIIAALAGCAARASEGGFNSDNPASKLYAIRRAGENHDRSAIPQLVQQLDDDDPAVRMMAIQALQRITGQRLGYNPYAAEMDRRAGVDRWVAWARTEQAAEQAQPH